LDGYEPTNDRWQRIFQTALSRDNLWISADERQAIAAGQWPVAVQKRIAKFHLVDNTRGEPPMWEDAEIRHSDWKLSNGTLSGKVHLETDDGKRGYQADVRGFVETQDGQVTRIDIVALGDFWGDGPYTGGAPEGKFPLAVGFTIGDGTDIADGVPPQGSRGWVDGYMN
jgi:hypothetical protein